MIHIKELFENPKDIPESVKSVFIKRGINIDNTDEVIFIDSNMVFLCDHKKTIAHIVVAENNFKSLKIFFNANIKDGNVLYSNELKNNFEEVFLP